MKRLSFPLEAVALLLVLAIPSGAAIVKKFTFDGPDPYAGLNIRGLGYRPPIVPDPKDPTKKVMCATHTFERHNKRSEVQGEQVPEGTERWIGARIMQIETMPKGWTCVFQVGPVSGPNRTFPAGLYQLDLKGTQDSPSYAVRGWMGRAGREDFSKAIGSFKYNEWDSFVFHIKLRSDEGGLFEVWKNGHKVLTDHGPNARKNDTMCIQWGIYHGVMNQGQIPIRCLYGDVVIGDAKSSYEEVAPKTTGGATKSGWPSTQRR